MAMEASMAEEHTGHNTAGSDSATRWTCSWRGERKRCRPGGSRTEAPMARVAWVVLARAAGVVLATAAAAPVVAATGPAAAASAAAVEAVYEAASAAAVYRAAAWRAAAWRVSVATRDVVTTAASMGKSTGRRHPTQSPRREARTTPHHSLSAGESSAHRPRCSGRLFSSSLTDATADSTDSGWRWRRCSSRTAPVNATSKSTPTPIPSASPASIRGIVATAGTRPSRFNALLATLFCPRGQEHGALAAASTLLTGTALSLAHRRLSPHPPARRDAWLQAHGHPARQRDRAASHRHHRRVIARHNLRKLPMECTPRHGQRERHHPHARRLSKPLFATQWLQALH